MVEVHRAGTARIHDFFRGGTDNYEADRQAARRIGELAPYTEQVIRGARRFVLHTVFTLARYHRISQFLDLGCGLPDTGRHLHEIAQRARHDARFIYVDRDPMVLTHAGMMLETDSHTRVIRADLRDGAGAVLARAEQTEETEESGESPLYRPGQPSAVLLCGTLDELGDEDAARLVDGITARVASGSYLVFYSLVSTSQKFRRAATALMNEVIPTGWGRVRTPEHIAGFFTGLKPTRPFGDVTTWYPPPPPSTATLPPTGWVAYGGIARRP